MSIQEMIDTFNLIKINNFSSFETAQKSEKVICICNMYPNENANPEY